jgi:uncharacterized protein (TIGR00369 family)
MQVSGRIEFTITDQREDRVLAEMPIQPGILNPYGTVHAGAMLWFADVSATVLVLQGTDPSGGMTGFPLAINLNANFFANQGDGLFQARSEYVKRGKSVSVVRTLLTGDNGRPIAEVTTSHLASR